MKKVEIKIIYKKGNRDLQKVLDELIAEAVKKALTKLYLERYNDSK